MVVSSVTSTINNLTTDAPEYTYRLHTPFKPAPLTLKPSELYAVVPKHCFERHTGKTMYYFLRSVSFSVLFAWMASKIDWAIEGGFAWAGWKDESGWGRWAVRWALWHTYWWWQGIVFTGYWVLGECIFLSNSLRVPSISGVVIVNS